MLLESDFYTIEERTETDSTLQARIRINPLHPIFEGHFPGQPVVPGVCMIQLLKELLETKERRLLLTSSRQIKFLQLLVPDADVPLSFFVDFQRSAEADTVEAVLKKEAQVVFKFQGIFSVSQDF